jgi:filamentous hemagglutinin
MLDPVNERNQAKKDINSLITTFLGDNPAPDEKKLRESVKTQAAQQKSQLDQIGEVLVNFSHGVWNAAATNISPLPYNDSNEYRYNDTVAYKVGKVTGDIASIALAIVEVELGLAIGAGGVTLSATGIGALLGIPAVAAGTAVAGHGVMTGTNAAGNFAENAGDLYRFIANGGNKGTGKAANDLGKLRTQRVADITGGTITEGPTVKTSRGVTDIDVTGPKGEIIEVGGPAKANDLGKFKTQLLKMQEVANSRGVPAQVYLEEGTPQAAIDIAKKTLGENNVITFTLK